MGNRFFVIGVYFSPDNLAFVKPDKDYFDMLATALMLIDKAEKLVICDDFNAHIGDVKFQKIESAAQFFLA